MLSGYDSYLCCLAPFSVQLRPLYMRPPTIRCPLCHPQPAEDVSMQSHVPSDQHDTGFVNDIGVDMLFTVLPHLSGRGHSISRTTSAVMVCKVVVGS